MTRFSIYTSYREYARLAQAALLAHGDYDDRKYPSGGLNLNAGNFSQLSKFRPFFVSRAYSAFTSCPHVPGTNRVSVLLLSVRIANAPMTCSPLLTWARAQKHWVRLFALLLPHVPLAQPPFDRPPRGRFSHLAMFRIGSLLYIPAYLSVVLYRVFASDKDDGNLILMAGESGNPPSDSGLNLPSSYAYRAGYQHVRTLV